MAVIEFQTHTKNELAGVDWAKNIDEYRFSPTPLLYMIFFLLIVRVRLKRFSQVWCQFDEKRIYLHKRIGKDNLKASTDNFDSEISKGTTLFLQLPSPPPLLRSCGIMTLRQHGSQMLILGIIACYSFGECSVVLG